MVRVISVPTFSGTGVYDFEQKIYMLFHRTLQRHRLLKEHNLYSGFDASRLSELLQHGTYRPPHDSIFAFTLEDITLAAEKKEPSELLVCDPLDFILGYKLPGIVVYDGKQFRKKEDEPPYTYLFCHPERKLDALKAILTAKNPLH